MRREETTVEIDLIYVEYSDCREMGVAVLGGDKDRLFDPVAANGAIKQLAPAVQQHLSERFSTVKAVEDHLTFIHFRNMSLRKNAAGQDYPYKINAKKSESGGTPNASA